MKRLLQSLGTVERVVEVQHVCDNCMEIRDFVGADNFRMNFGGQMLIRIRNQPVPINIGDSVVRFESGRIDVMTAQELEQHFEVIKDPYEEENNEENPPQEDEEGVIIDY